MKESMQTDLWEDLVEGNRSYSDIQEEIIMLRSDSETSRLRVS